MAAPTTSPPSGGGLKAQGFARWQDPLFRWVVTLSGVTVLVILAWMIGSTTADAIPIIRHEGLWSFLTGQSWSPGRSRTEVTGTYQALTMIYGTIVVSFLAVVIAVPLAIGVSLWLTQIAPPWIKKPMTYAVELLAAIPSVVYGLWGVGFFIPVVLLPMMRFLAEYLGWIPIFSPPISGLSFFSAGTVLAIMILPIITAVTREVFETVPVAERDAGYGLGATRWEVMRHVIIPRGLAGIIGATMLGLGRALGETIAVALLIGSSLQIVGRLFAPGIAIPAQIVNTFAESAPEGINALIALGVALFAITIVVNVLARFIIWRFGVTGDAAV